FTPESSFSTSRSLSFAPSIRVEDPTLSIVAIRLRLVSFSGASDSITFQRPLNSSISAMSFRISGVIVMLLILWVRISIYTHCYPIRHKGKRYPFLPIYTRLRFRVESRFAVASTLCLLAGSQILMGDIGSAVAMVQRTLAARRALHTFAARFNGVLA